MAWSAPRACSAPSACSSLWCHGRAASRLPRGRQREASLSPYRQAAASTEYSTLQWQRRVGVTRRRGRGAAARSLGQLPGGARRVSGGCSEGGRGGATHHADDDIVDRDEDELHKEADEAHDEEADRRGLRDLRKFCEGGQVGATAGRRVGLRGEEERRPCSASATQTRCGGAHRFCRALCTASPGASCP